MNIIRIFFTKTGEAAYISHLDLQRVMARALRISGMPVWYSQGFNPHIYMSFALPLPLGQQSLCECVDVKSEAEAGQCKSYQKALDAALPRGIGVKGIDAPQHAAGEIERAEYTLSFPGADDAETLAAWYNAQPEARVLRKTKRSQQEVDLKQYVPRLAPQKNGGTSCFCVDLPAGGEKHINPGLLMEFLKKAGDELETAEVRRCEIFVKNHIKFC